MELLPKKELGAGPDRTSRPVDNGSKPRVLEVTVDVDDACHEASDAFDYELCVENLENAMGDRRWVLGAIVGPSGTGKSCNMKRLSRSSSDENALHWLGRGYYSRDSRRLKCLKEYQREVVNRSIFVRIIAMQLPASTMERLHRIPKCGECCAISCLPAPQGMTDEV